LGSTHAIADFEMLIKLAPGYSTMTEYNNTAILVGGLSNKYLYQLSSPDDQWVEMKQALKERRAAHVAFLIPDNIVNCF